MIDLVPIAAEAVERTSSTSWAASRTKIRWSSRSDTVHDHLVGPEPPIGAGHEARADFWSPAGSSTKSSVSFAASLPASSASQPRTFSMIRYTIRTANGRDHAPAGTPTNGQVSSRARVLARYKARRTRSLPPSVPSRGRRTDEAQAPARRRCWAHQAGVDGNRRQTGGPHHRGRRGW